MWVRLSFRPFLRFVVWYFFRLGILDGRQGYVFCLLMAWYELLVGLKIEELKKARKATLGHEGEQASLSVTAADL